MDSEHSCKIISQPLTSSSISVNFQTTEQPPKQDSTVKNLRILFFLQYQLATNQYQMVRSTFSSFPLSKCRRLTRQCRESNPGLLGEKRERYLCATPPPQFTDTLIRAVLQKDHLFCGQLYNIKFSKDKHNGSARQVKSSRGHSFKVKLLTSSTAL